MSTRSADANCTRPPPFMTAPPFPAVLRLKQGTAYHTKEGESVLPITIDNGTQQDQQHCIGCVGGISSKKHAGTTSFTPPPRLVIPMLGTPTCGERLCFSERQCNQRILLKKALQNTNITTYTANLEAHCSIMVDMACASTRAEENTHR